MCGTGTPTIELEGSRAGFEKFPCPTPKISLIVHGGSNLKLADTTSSLHNAQPEAGDRVEEAKFSGQNDVCTTERQ